MVTTNQNDTLLEVRNLSTQFATDEGTVRAVDGVSFRIRRGETLAVVGESGCGKSVTALSIMRLIPDPPGRIVGGEVRLHDPSSGDTQDLLKLPDSQIRRVRGNRIAMVFQEPASAFNPVFTIGQQIAEAVSLHRRVKRKDANLAAVDLLERVGISDPARRAGEYPHQMSGGMLQRAMIAMSISCSPSLLIADEPTTALDVTVQAQILSLLRDLQRKNAMSILFITHDLGVVAQIADRVCVMYAGRIVEEATVGELFECPLHPYTAGLMRSLPRMEERQARLRVIPGQVPNPLHYPQGCRFHPRCDLTRRRAEEVDRPRLPLRGPGDTMEVLSHCVETGERSGGSPDLREVRPGHWVACWECEGYETTPKESVDS